LRLQAVARVITFVRRIAGLSEPSLESELYEEFSWLSRFLDELIVVSSMVDAAPRGFKVHRAWAVEAPKVGWLMKAVSYCYAVLKNAGLVDTVYVRTFSPPEAIALWVGRKVLKKRAVLLLPGTWLLEGRGLRAALYRWVLSRAVYAADLLILYTPLMLPRVEAFFPRLGEDKVRYLHNAVNVERFKPGEPDERVLAKYLTPRPRRLLLYVGLIARRKGVLDLVRAFARIIKEEPEAVLALAGREEEPYASEVKALVKELGLEGSVRFLGPVPNEDVVHLMRVCDVFLYASRGGEGIPRAVLEAMACGKPIVATQVGGVREAVRDGETGYTVEVGDIGGLAEATLRLLREEELRRRLGKNARLVVEKEFNYEKAIPKLAELIASCYFAAKLGKGQSLTWSASLAKR
jgi:glycosyltransferase involved in cell wall biosynthesis